MANFVVWLRRQQWAGVSDSDEIPCNFKLTKTLQPADTSHSGVRLRCFQRSGRLYEPFLEPDCGLLRCYFVPECYIASSKSGSGGAHYDIESYWYAGGATPLYGRNSSPRIDSLRHQKCDRPAQRLVLYVTPPRLFQPLASLVHAVHITVP